MTEPVDAMPRLKHPTTLTRKTNLPEALASFRQQAPSLTKKTPAVLEITRHLRAALASFRYQTPSETKKLPKVLEIPRQLHAGQLQALPKLDHEIRLDIFADGIYVVEGEENSVPRLANAMPSQEFKPPIIDMHSHPIIVGQTDKQHGGVYTYEPQTISPEDIYLLCFQDNDIVNAVITTHGVLVYGWPTRIPDGVDQSFDLTRLDAPREIMPSYAISKGMSGRMFYDLNLQEGDEFFRSLIEETGMLIAEVPWSDSQRIEQAISIMNSTPDRTTARQQFVALA